MSEQPGQGEGGSGARPDVPNGVGAPERPPAYQQPVPPPGPAGPDASDGAGRRSLWLGVGGLVVSLFFWPLGLVLDIAAVVIGTKARRKAAAVRGRAPGATAGIVTGAIGTLLGALALIMAVVILPETNTRTQCLDKANTLSEEKVCDETYMRDLEEKFGLPKGSMDRYSGMF
ncbi:DUF4190 domain-containing protein [Actinomadura hibisca]|uniref:DUF4190 domain-containing protein n=1 Tax=Actinomadura hibisca TaxID=68565 RepID=UPI00082EC714|nr:DUF4190 domain-containing protein [Actinomadura hibisca]